MVDKLTKTVIGCAMEVHRALGSGFLESVYGNALAHELGKSNISYQRESLINVVYDNTGLLLNFGAPSLQFKRKYRLNPQNGPVSLQKQT